MLPSLTMCTESEYEKDSYLVSVEHAFTKLHSFLIYESDLEQLYYQTMLSGYISTFPVRSMMATPALVKSGARIFPDSNITIQQYR